jgi:hypothetical protein
MSRCCYIDTARIQDRFTSVDFATMTSSLPMSAFGASVKEIGTDTSEMRNHTKREGGTRQPRTVFAEIRNMNSNLKRDHT